MAGFNNYRGMLDDLEDQNISNQYVSKFIANMRNMRELSDIQRQEIVRLYNIYCMPKNKFAK